MVIHYNKELKKYILTINETYNDYHDSKDSAASNVYMHETGYTEWDDLHGIVDPPHDISEWLIS